MGWSVKSGAKRSEITNSLKESLGQRAMAIDFATSSIIFWTIMVFPNISKFRTLATSTNLVKNKAQVKSLIAHLFGN